VAGDTITVKNKAPSFFGVSSKVIVPIFTAVVTILLVDAVRGRN
jgi:hypothetical protein